MTIPFKRIKEVLTAKAYKDFEKFMTGQTVCGEGVYDHDFIRWMKEWPVID